MQKNKYLKKYWNQKDFEELQSDLNLSLSNILELAFNNGIHQSNTLSKKNVKRTWTKEEDEFLISKSKNLNTTQAAIILKRSRYATYQHIRLLGLNNMIKTQKVN